MTDDPTQAMGPIDEPTVPVEAVGGDSGPPTEAMPALPADDEPPRGNGLRAAIIIVLLLLVATLVLVLLTRDSADDRGDVPVDRTTTTSVDRTTTTTVADSTTTTTTASTTTTTSTTTSTTVAAPGPSIDSLTASAVTCPDPLTLTWTSTNAVSVEVAIDNPGGVFDTGPPSGSMEVPAPCGTDTQTYYVTAVGSTGDRATETLVLP